MTQREPNARDTRVVYNTTPEPVRAQGGVTMPEAQTMRPTPVAHTYTETVDNQPAARTYDVEDIHVETNVEAPIDRVRWGSILAGLFAALSTLALLSLLGLAIGASTFDGGDRARDFGIGAGIWGGLSALLAFLVGGWVAARTAAVRGERNGMLNGAMVWAVAIPLLLYLLGSGLGALVGTAANAGAEAAGAVAGQVGNDPALQGNVQDGAAGLENLASPQNIAGAAESTARTAWGTLGSLLLGLGAASLGGYLGARRPNFGWSRRSTTV